MKEFNFILIPTDSEKYSFSPEEYSIKADSYKLAYFELLKNHKIRSLIDQDKAELKIAPNQQEKQEPFSKYLLRLYRSDIENHLKDID